MTSRSTAVDHPEWNTDSPLASSFELKSTTTGGETVDTPSPSRPGSPNSYYRNGMGLPAPDGGKQAWFVLAGAFCITLMYGGLPYGYGIFQAALSKTNLASTPILVILGSIPLFIMALTAIPAHAVVERFGNRNTAILGALLVSLSQLLAGFSTKSLVGLFILFGPIQGVGSAFCFLSTVPLISQYFDKRRGLATGLCYSSAGIGGAVLSLLESALIERFSVKWAYHAVGLLSLTICIPSALLMKPLESRRRPPSQRRILDSTVFRSPSFILVCCAAAVVAFTLFTPSFFLATYAETLGYSPSVGAQLSMGYNLSSAVGRIGFGFLADRFMGEMNALVLGVLLSGISCLTIWPFATSLPPLAAFSVISGMTCGSWFALIPGVCAALLGNWLVGSALAWQELFGSAGYLLGGPVAGMILDAAGGAGEGVKAFRPAMYYSGSCTLFAAGLIIAGRLLYTTKLQRI